MSFFDTELSPTSLPPVPEQSDKGNISEVFREMKILHYNETVVKKGAVESIAQRVD